MTTEPAPAPAPEPAWIQSTEAATILGIPRRHNTKQVIERMAAAGLITVRDLPGVRARYLRADVERLAKESVKPAIR